MKKPKVVMHDSISLDGSFVGFESDAEQHYRVIRDYQAKMSLWGSKTLVTGLEKYDGFSPEVEADFDKPDKGNSGAYWVVVDSGGITRGWLHIARRSPHCRDVILLVSEKTDHEFIDYLEERNYDFFVCGKHKVDLDSALNWLAGMYNVETIRVDAGPTLNRVLLAQKLLDEISLLVHPLLVGRASDKLLNQLTDLSDGVKLELIKSETEAGTVYLRYKVKY